MRISPDFFQGTTEEIAQKLLGQYLVHQTPNGILSGFLVDVEAYLGPEDQAAHSFGMRNTPRVKAMYQAAGTIYLYTMHTHLILNIITQEKGIPQGVMIRGLEPAQGLSEMIANRNGVKGPNLSNGPGKLVAALGIQKDLYGQNLFESELSIDVERQKIPKKIVALPRIGIPNKGSWTEAPLRYVVEGNPYLTKQKKSEIAADGGWRN